MPVNRVIWRRDVKQIKAVMHRSYLVNVHQQYLTEHPTRYLTAALIYFCIRPELFDKDRESWPEPHPR